MPPETLAPHRVFEGEGFKKSIKKPACGRLLGGGFGLFLVSRTRLQSGHPARCDWVWGVTAFCGLALHSGSPEARRDAQVRRIILGFRCFSH